MEEKKTEFRIKGKKVTWEDYFCMPAEDWMKRTDEERKRDELFCNEWLEEWRLSLNGK